MTKDLPPDWDEPVPADEVMDVVFVVWHLRPESTPQLNHARVVDDLWGRIGGDVQTLPIGFKTRAFLAYRNRSSTSSAVACAIAWIRSFSS